MKRCLSIKETLFLLSGTFFISLGAAYVFIQYGRIFIFRGQCLKEVFGFGFIIKGPYKRGEGVFFTDEVFARRINYPQDAGFAKKVVGVPGDHIKVQGVRVQVYEGKALIWEGEAQKRKDHFLIEERQIPLSHYFLAGIFSNSIDSRYQTLGLVAEDKIEGKWWGW